MKVAIIHYAEPVSRDDGFVLTRYSSVAKCLQKNNYKVTRYFPSFNHRSRRFRKFGSYIDKEFGNHVRVITSDYYRSRSIKRLLFLSTFKKNLMKELLKLKYDLYLVGCPMPGIASAIRKEFPRAKIVLDLRDFWPDIQVSLVKGVKKFIYLLLGYKFKKLTKSDLKSADHIVTLSDSYAKKIKKISNCINNLTVIPLGSVLNSINDQKFLKKNYHKKRGVIFVGSLSDLFDFDRLLKVWKIFENKYPELAKSHKLTIVGHGSNSEWLSNKVKKLKFAKVIGYIPQNDALSLMRSSKVAIVLYKKMSYFTLPNKLFEFARSGLPIISNWSGDVITNTKDYGFTFGFENITNEEIVVELKNLLTKDNNFKNAFFGAIQFSKDFSRTKSAEKFKKIVNTILKKNVDK